jgi:serine/threonine protein kinase
MNQEATMPPAPAGPGVSQYERLTSDRLPDAEKAAVLDHLERCEACAQEFGALLAGDTLANLIRQARTSEDEASAETVARLVERMSRLRPEEIPVGAELASPPHGVVDSVRGTAAYSMESAPDRKLYDFLAPPQAADEIGRLGPYRVLQVLGAGGMGVVFRAEDPQLARLVALKAMLPALAASPSARQRFLREGRAAAAIKHDHIVTIYQVGEDRGVPFLAMELLEGEPLDVRMQREGKLSPADVLRIGRDMALGLAAAHGRGLIHRDIKPANVWLETRDGGRRMKDEKEGQLASSFILHPSAFRVKILDFGLARGAGEGGRITQLGAIVGTPAYMAPEQAQGKGVDARGDLFSLGCVLYRMATGAPPFSGTDMISTLMALATETPRPPNEIETTLPPALSDLILKLLAREPGDRPPSAQAVAETLERIAHESAAPGPGPTPSPSARPMTGKQRFLLAGAAAAVLLLALVGLWLGGVFKVKTKQGTIVLENVPADAEVIVEDGEVTFKSSDGKTVEIRLTAGKKHPLAVKKDGVTIFGQEVEIDAGGRRSITVHWEPPAPPRAEDQPLKPGSVWVGKRTYRKGWYAGSTVTYELHVRERDGTKFKGHVFDNGPGRNRAEVEGEIKGQSLLWREQGRFPELHLNIQGRLTGDTIRFTLKGERTDGWIFTEGDGELTLRKP